MRMCYYDCILLLMQPRRHISKISHKGVFVLGENAALKAHQHIKPIGRSAIALAAILAGMVFAVLWPFNFRNDNDVRILPDGAGIELGRLALIYESKPVPTQSIVDFVRATKSMAIEICFQAGRNRTHGVDVMLAINDNHMPPICTIGQWRSHLVIRSRVSPAAGKNRYGEIGARDVFRRGEKQHLVITWDENDAEFPGTTVWLNGEPVRAEPSFELIRGIEQLEHSRLSVGNALDGEAPWRGKIYALSIYSAGMKRQDVERRYSTWRTTGKLPLDRPESLIAQYAFRSLENGQISNSVEDRNHLDVPTEFRAPQKSKLDIPLLRGNLGIGFYVDTFTNILGFMPFGALVFRIASRTRKLRHKPVAAVTLTMLAGGLFSFLIEFAQTYLPTRSSSLADLVTNIVGTAAGIALFRAAAALARRGQPARQRPQDQAG